MTASASTPSRRAPWSISSGPTCARKYSIRTSQAPNARSFYSRDDYLKMIPLERFPRASDLAWAAVFLASDESSFITGADIPVDGGLRFKYPTWRPGDHTGVNIADYARSISLTEYGEDKGKLITVTGARADVEATTRSSDDAFRSSEMTETERTQAMAERLKLLHQCRPGTEMGELLRLFWQPVAPVEPDRGRRGQAGPHPWRRTHPLSRRKRHAASRRRALSAPADAAAYRLGPGRSHPLHVSRLAVRRIGPMHRASRPKTIRSPPNIRIVSYPVHEYAGLIFAYLGEGAGAGIPASAQGRVRGFRSG